MFSRLMWIPIVWSLISVPGIVTGARKKLEELVASGVVILCVAGSMVFVRGMVFDPPALFEPVFNIRVLAVIIVGGVFVLSGRIARMGWLDDDWGSVVFRISQFGSLLLLFALLTGETRDYFEAAMIRLSDGMEAERASQANLQQLSLSGMWLLYSLLLIGYGIWRSQREIRIAAFALFGLTILKIFLYDLSYLETLYRIFSFIALGLVLLGVSYAYQKYKHLIFGPGNGPSENSSNS